MSCSLKIYRYVTGFTGNFICLMVHALWTSHSNNRTSIGKKRDSSSFLGPVLSLTYVLATSIDCEL